MTQIKKTRFVQTVSIKDTPSTASTVLIPNYLVDAMEARLESHDWSVRTYLRFLLDRFRDTITNQRTKHPASCKKTYQAAGLELQPKHFRPTDTDWAELGILADSLGLTKCLLFVLLLTLDLQRESSGKVDRSRTKRPEDRLTLVGLTRLNLFEKNYARRLEIIYNSQWVLKQRFRDWLRGLFHTL